MAKDSLLELVEIKAALDESSIVAITDKNGVIKYVNEKFCNISKYSRGELIGKTHRVINSGFHSKEFFRQMWKTISGGKIWSGEIKNKAKDGSFYWVSTTIVPILDDKRKPFEYVSVRHDITKQKQAEEELRESENKLNTVLNSLPSHIAVLDKNGNITNVNKSWSDFTIKNGGKKYLNKTGVGVNYLEVCEKAHESPEAGAVAAGIKKVLSGNLKHFTTEYSCHSPKENRWFLMTVTPAEFDDSGAVIAHTNITSRKISELNLRSSEEKLRMVLDASKIGVWFYDIPADKAEWSLENCRIFGLEKFDGRSETFWNMVDPRDCGRIKKEFEEAINEGVYYDVEFRITRPDGKKHWIKGLGHCKYDSDGKPLRFLGTNQDITERKYQEKQKEYLSKLNEIFRTETESSAIEEKVTHLAMNFFGSDRCYYAVIEDGFATIRHDDFKGNLTSVAAKYQLSDFPVFKKIVDEGKPFIVYDAETSEILDEELRKICITNKVISFIDVPVTKNGEVVGIFSLVQSNPRNWTKLEIDLALITAERVLTAIEKIIAENSLRESEEKLRIFVEHAPAAVAMFDREMRYLAVSRRWKEDYGLEGQIIGQSHYEVFPQISESRKEIHRRCLAGAVEKSDAEKFERSDGSVQFIKWEVRPWQEFSGEIGGIIIFTEDITKERKFEEQLRLFEKVIVNARDAILITEAEPIDLPGPRIVYINPAFTKMTGYQKDDINGLTPRILQGQKTDRKKLDLIRKSLSEWSPVRVDLTNYRKDGSEFEVDFDIFPVADENGWFTHWVSIQRDVTRQKKLELSLQESEEKYRLFFQNNPLPIFIVDHQTNEIIEVNKSAVKLYGYTRKELIRSNLFELIYPEDREKIKQIISDPSITKLSVRHQKKNGEIIHVEVIRYKFNYDGRPARFAIIQDVTERKTSETTIKEKNLLLEQTYDAIFIWHFDDGIIEWNQNSEMLYGYSAKEANGKIAHQLLKTIFPAGQAEFLKELKENSYWEGELIHTTKNGNEVIVESRLHLLKNLSGNFVVFETAHDVTERRQIEAKLTRAAQLSMIGELAAGLAHEIKNPLAGIKGVIDVLLQRRNDNEYSGNEGEKLILESVSHGIKRIDNTVRELLLHSRPKPLEMTIAPFEETVRRAVQFSIKHSNFRLKNKKNIQTILNFPASTIPLLHDPSKMEDVVLNLVLNAQEAIGDDKNGIVSVTLSVNNSEETGEKGILLEVTDNGCGIPPEKLDQIFMPFQTTKEFGTGLGLASVKRIVRLHGGICEVRSTLGKGSTFSILLPANIHKI